MCTYVLTSICVVCGGKLEWDCGAKKKIRELWPLKSQSEVPAVAQAKPFDVSHKKMFSFLFHLQHQEISLKNSKPYKIKYNKFKQSMIFYDGQTSEETSHVLNFCPPNFVHLPIKRYHDFSQEKYKKYPSPLIISDHQDKFRPSHSF